ncbi:MAG: hypothetical protein ACKVS7_06770 [Gemmatimonadaceae bacterium]
MRFRLATFVLALLPAVVDAQDSKAVILAPQLTSYTLGSGASKSTISQTAVPFMVLLPFSERFSMDITSAFASSTADAGATEGKISGLTDTQIRANFTPSSRSLIFTIGLNVPTGQYTIPEDQQEAAGQIGNDFLNYPVSSMGNGLAGTGGVAYARTLGTWNLGLGTSFRKSTEFAAFAVASSEFRFQPADEIRLQLGLDRPVGDGQIEFGLSYSAFGEDVADTTSYSTGDRIMATGAWTFPVKKTDVFLSVWNLYRMEGQRFGGDAPTENVANFNVGVSFELGSVVLQPNVETRLWQADGKKAGNLFNTGVRARFGAGSFTFIPAVGVSAGNIYDIGSGAGTKVSGLRSSLTIRWN